eukprot:Nk52_evm14s554 gene=Nk52_evmTU14s554
MSTFDKDVKTDSSLPVKVIDNSDANIVGVKEKKRLPLWQLFLIATPWLGVQAVWSLEFALTSNYLYDSLGVKQSLAVLIFILGPVTGMTVGPIIGALSDNWTGKYGRRRPFIAFGVIVVAASSMIFCNAGNIVSNNTGAIVLAFIAFGILDAFMNVLQGPLRAILADLACEDQQEIVQAFASFFQGAGTIIGYQLGPLLGGLDNIVMIFGIALGALFVFSIPVFIFGKEEPYVPAVEMQKKDVVKGALKNLYGGLLKMPSSMIKICVVQFFCWLTWMMYNGVNPLYVPNEIYGAKNFPEDSPKYKDLTSEGTDFASSANSYGGIVQLVFSFVLVVLMKYAPGRITIIKNSTSYFAAFIPAKMFYAACLTPFIIGYGGIWLANPPSKDLYIFFVCIVYISYAAMNVFPFAICGRLYGINQVGTNMGLLNIFICIPQIIAYFSVSAISDQSGDQAVVLFMTITSIIAFVCCLFVDASGKKSSNTAADFKAESA